MTATPWNISATWVEACNCDYGCPCNFNGFPTRGNCEGVVGFRVHSGRHGETSLDGVTVLVAAYWPKAIHDGNGKARIFIDESAKQPQVDAIVRIMTGQDGGMPWEILAPTLTELDGPHLAPITFDEKGEKTRFAVADIDVQLTPFTNPVTGEEHTVHTVLPTGFIFRDGAACTSTRNTFTIGDQQFDWTGKNAYVAKVEWSNA